MTITFLGCAGIGLVWGWLIGQVISNNIKGAIRIIGLVIASLFTAAPVFFFAGSRGVLIFVFSGLFTLWIRTWWSRELQQRSQV
jgi:hypothetical protein